MLWWVAVIVGAIGYWQHDPYLFAIGAVVAIVAELIDIEVAIRENTRRHG